MLDRAFGISYSYRLRLTVPVLEDYHVEKGRGINESLLLLLPLSLPHLIAFLDGETQISIVKRTVIVWGIRCVSFMRGRNESFSKAGINLFFLLGGINMDLLLK